MFFTPVDTFLRRYLFQLMVEGAGAYSAHQFTLGRLSTYIAGVSSILICGLVVYHHNYSTTALIYGGVVMLLAASGMLVRVFAIDGYEEDEEDGMSDWNMGSPFLRSVVLTVLLLVAVIVHWMVPVSLTVILLDLSFLGILGSLYFPTCDWPR